MPPADRRHRTERFLALAVPAFPLAARLRADADLSDRPVAVTSGRGTAARVVAASRPARERGVRPGMGIARARALLPDLLVLPRDPEAERSAAEALLEAAGTLSPRLEATAEGLVFADLAGTRWPSERHLARISHQLPATDGDVPATLALLPATPPATCLEHASVASWSKTHTDRHLHALATKVGEECGLAEEAIHAARRLGLPTRAGVASSRLVARLAASRTGQAVVVGPGQEAAFLAPLPVALLGPSRRAAERLRQWGITRIGDLARLPAAEVAARLGREGQTLHRAAHGIDPRPFVPVPPPETLREGVQLDWAVHDLHRLLTAMEAPLERLVRRLSGRGTGCRLLELELALETGERARRSIRLPRPAAEAGVLLDLAGLELERRPPHAPVTVVALVAHPAQVPQTQLSLFGPEELSPGRISTALARLAAVTGPSRVGSPAPPDTHLPEPPVPVPYDPPPAPAAVREPGPPPGFLALRRLDPPRPVEVTTASRDGRPVFLRTPPGTTPRIQGPIRTASGPWPLDTGWWDTPTVRTGWDVELPGGLLLRIHRTSHGDWSIDGIYD